MIIEGLVTTQSAQGKLNVAAMGAITDGLPREILLRPFRSSTTFQNLHELPEGVFHLTENAYLLAMAAIDQLTDPPPARPAQHVRGWILEDSCQHFEFRVADRGPLTERASLRCQIVGSGRGRDFSGFNRAKHAVVELAILASRVHLLPPEVIRQATEFYEPLIQKTAGPEEQQAWEMLQRYIRSRLEEPF